MLSILDGPPAGRDRWIRDRRPPRLPVDLQRPVAVLTEPERDDEGRVGPVLTVFLANRECGYTCLMCDLWKHTAEEPTPAGAIVSQVRQALTQRGDARTIKLYNAGSFFDTKAIPRTDRAALVSLLGDFDRVVVECHPALVGPELLTFNEELGGILEVGLGLETCNGRVLERLNKRMTLADYDRAVTLLVSNGIRARTFVLLRPPFVTEDEGIYWAHQSVLHAAGAGSHCTVVIPTRPGNGALDELAGIGLFHSPRLGSLEVVMDRTVDRGLGRVLSDLWDVESLETCPQCGPARIERLKAMNLSGRREPSVSCGPGCRP